MKKHVSVLGLFARSSLPAILGILLLMSGVEVLFFHLELNEALTAYGAGVGSFPQPERMLSSAGIYIYFRAGLILCAGVLCLFGCRFRTQTGYTWRRLSIREPNILILQTVYNTAVILLLWLIQTLVAYGLCRYYLAVAPAEVLSNQTLFLAFYRNNFLHSLLPLSDIVLWLRNALLLLALGLSTALLPFKQRRGKLSGSVIAVLTYATVGFDREIGEGGHIAIAATLLVLVAAEAIAAYLHADENEDSETEVSDNA